MEQLHHFLSVAMELMCMMIMKYDSGAMTRHIFMSLLEMSSCNFTPFSIRDVYSSGVNLHLSDVSDACVNEYLPVSTQLCQLQRESF